MPACSSGTLTNVLPHRNAMPQTQDTTSHPVTVYRHGANLSLCYPSMWNVTLEYTATHFNVLGETRPGNPSPTFHTHQRTFNLMLSWWSTVGSSVESTVYIYTVHLALLAAFIAILSLCMNVIGYVKNMPVPSWCWINPDVSHSMFWTYFTGKMWELLSYAVILVLYGHIKCFLYQQVSHPGAVRAHQVLPVSAGQSTWCFTGTSSASCISRLVNLVLYGHIKCFLYQQVSHPDAVRAHQVVPVSAD